MNFDAIRNYYEHLVINYLMEEAAPKAKITDEELLEDIACLALNNVPARYIRHEVDMAFFLTSAERDKMRDNVIQAVDAAIKIIQKNAQEAAGE
ncbi:MAG: late competence development ComFB family protein [Gammaproteobacteria bacterium]|nr:late competence development ComFB family protein [Gammaproteobacteria bacterium]